MGITFSSNTIFRWRGLSGQIVDVHCVHCCVCSGLMWSGCVWTELCRWKSSQRP